MKRIVINYKILKGIHKFRLTIQINWLKGGLLFIAKGQTMTNDVEGAPEPKKA